MSDPPKRYESELTVVIDRDKLPPRSTVAGPTIEQLGDCTRALQDGIPTLESCPACAGCDTCEGRHFVACPTCTSNILTCQGSCSTCSVCLGQHMLSAEEAAAWRRENLFVPPPEAA